MDISAYKGGPQTMFVSQEAMDLRLQGRSSDNVCVPRSHGFQAALAITDQRRRAIQRGDKEAYKSNQKHL